ncbi:hypothetical protein GKO46_13135 [SAR202 cluster bacterium JH702]|uniref:Uncharacterized protein n=1 Tax=Candidatus Lucifugimonas marina TaxID=3038979 RepID=A0ABD4XTP9_9CHLR|nr:hypothetical protein [SAR202 cluster bacterium JH702]
MAHPDPVVRRLYAQSAAHSRWAKYDAVAGTKAARAAFERSFLDAADPEGKLSERDRLKRATHLRKAHFAKMAAKSAAVRRKR